MAEDSRKRKALDYLSSVYDENEALREENEALKKENEALKKEREALREDNNNLKENDEASKEKSEALKEELDRAREALHKDNNEWDLREKELKTGRRKITLLNRVAKAQISTLQQAVVGGSREMTHLKDKAELLEKCFKNEKDENARLKHNNSLQSIDLLTASGENTSLRQELETEVKKVDELRNLITTLMNMSFTKCASLILQQQSAFQGKSDDSRGMVETLLDVLGQGNGDKSPINNSGSTTATSKRPSNDQDNPADLATQFQPQSTTDDSRRQLRVQNRQNYNQDDFFDQTSVWESEDWDET